MTIGSVEVRLALVAITILTLSMPAFPAEMPSALPQQAADELQEAIAAVPGLSIAVGTGDRVRWAQGFGRADLELGVAVTPDTRFLVYSAAKAWTAAAGARLAERGELGVEDPIERYLPGLPAPLGTVTPMQLALHQSGVRHYADESEAVSSRHCGTVDEALPIFVDDALQFAPGTSQGYSSWGYVLLSAVLERASESAFPALLEREVFAPAGMEGVTLADPHPILAHRAEPYARRGDGWQNVPGLDVTCKWGAGGFLATPTDLVRFYLALFRGDLVGPAFRPLLLRTDSDGLLRFGGFGAGGRSLVVANPEAGWVVALTANAGDPEVDWFPAALRIAEMLDP